MTKFICALVALVFSALASTASADVLWRRYETPNFILYSNTTPKLATAYLVRLEQYRYALGDFYGIPADPSQNGKVLMYFLNDRKNFLQILPDVPEQVQGVMKGCMDGSAAIAVSQGDGKISKRAISSKEENNSQIVIFHEYAHHFMLSNASEGYPSWFVEGFAEFYSTIAFEEDRMLVGMASTSRVYTLSSAKWLSYERILRSDPSIRDEKDGTAFFYAQSWLLSHYILSDPSRKAQFDNYIIALNQGGDPIASFEEIMGIKVSDLTTVLKRYLQKNLMATIYRLHDMPAPEVAISDLPVSSEKLLLWDAAIRICPNTDYEDKLLESIRTEAALYPDDDYAQLVLARAEVSFGDEQKALDLLAPYTARNPDDAEAHYLIGRAWALSAQRYSEREGETFEGQMDKARKAMTRSYKLNPTYAPNLYHLSQAQFELEDYPNATAVNAALQAHYLAPSVISYAMLAARLLIETDRLAEARQVLTTLASNPHDENLAQWARNVIDVINADGSQNDVRDAFSKPIRRRS